MENDAQPGQLARSENVQLEFDEDEAENEIIGGLHDQATEERFFDSRDYRVCFNCIHVKICLFVLATWILHSIIICSLYLLSIFEENEAKSSILVILLCRIAQVITVGLLYYGLWKFKKQYIVSFVAVQFTLGIFADISTLLILIRQLYVVECCAAPVFYFAIVGFLVYVLYFAYKFLEARNIHEEKRRQQDNEHRETLNSHFGLNGSGAGFLSTGRKDSVVPNTDDEMRSNSPSLPFKTQNAIAMKSLSRTPSSQINPRAAGFLAEHLKFREELIKQRSGKNPTGSLQQLTTSSFAGRQPLPTNASAAQPKESNVGGKPRMSMPHGPFLRYDQSEPMLNRLLSKNP
ncbi:hypothetical protein M3Y97_00780800 [Aphelenchoides bicaudatus]|nr:hypothetical protein M3Y97_00780800 [Aphelenchoides bicaudatus]